MKRILIPFILILIITQISCNSKKQVDLILYNGTIFTSDTNNLYTSALAISGNKIVQIGETDDILALKSENTKLIDLKGKLVVPGFNDAHYHLTKAIKGNWLNLSSKEPEWSEVLKILKDTISNIEPGEWIFGTIGKKVILNPDVNRFVLDSIAPDNPVYLMNYFGHGEVINTKAMTEGGIDENQKNPTGGFYERVNGSDIINGKIYEYASWNLQRKLTNHCSDEVIVNRFQSFGETALKYGITSIQNMSYLPLKRFINLWSESNVPIRMRAIRFPVTNDEKSLREDMEVSNNPIPGKNIKVFGIKWILDGTPIERGAVQRKDYADLQNYHGRLNFDISNLDSFILEGLNKNEQMLLHCVGDSTALEVMMSMKRVGDKINWPEKRLRIEHGDGIYGDLIPLSKDLGIIVVQNPTHFTFVETFNARYWEKTNYTNIKTLLKNNIPLAIGSDGPNSPFLNLMLAVQNPYRPDESISLEQAIIAYTLGAAYAEFEEESKGSISVGKLADMVVLSQNIFEIPMNQIHATESVLTIIDGEIVYDNGEL